MSVGSLKDPRRPSMPGSDGSDEEKQTAMPSLREIQRLDISAEFSQLNVKLRELEESVLANICGPNEYNSVALNAEVPLEPAPRGFSTGSRREARSVIQRKENGNAVPAPVRSWPLTEVQEMRRYRRQAESNGWEASKNQSFGGASPLRSNHHHLDCGENNSPLLPRPRGSVGLLDLSTDNLKGPNRPVAEVGETFGSERGLPQSGRRLAPIKSEPGDPGDSLGSEKSQKKELTTIVSRV